jgi:hypothetical protein
LLSALSCAGNQAPPAEAAPPAPASAAPSAMAPAPEAPASAAAATPSGPIDWAAMDKPARGKYMKELVLPKMKEAFVAFDATKYAGMNCATCHGSGAMDHSFTMPNPDLPKIPGDMAKFKEWAAKKPQMAEFMGKTVKPEMAKLLNEPEWTPATKTGFGCTACHTMEK